MASRKLLSFDPTYGYATELNTGDTATAGIFQGGNIANVSFDAQGGKGINFQDPTNPQDAATKKYVDGIAQGISAIPSVRAMASGNVAISGLQTIDGVQLAAGDRVLLTGQINGVQNGVWIVASGAWSRPTVTDDYTSGGPATGRYVFVEEGTNYSSEGWLCVTSGNAIVDTTATKWTQFTGLGEVLAGSGLITSAINGNTIAVNLAAASGLQFTNAQLDTLISGTGGLTKGASGLATLLNTNNTLASDASGLRVLGVPQNFTLGGTATSANVTATNLAMLTAGTVSYADSLHNHKNVLSAKATSDTHSVGVACNAGDPVQWSSTADTLSRCDNVALVSSQVIGIVAAAASANSQVNVIKRGVASGVLNGATPGAVYYLAPSGGITPTLPTTNVIVVVGRAKNSTDLDVQPQFIGQRSAS